MATPKFRESRIDFSKFGYDEYVDFSYINGICQREIQLETFICYRSSYSYYLKAHNLIDDFWKQVKEKRRIEKIEIPDGNKFIIIKRPPVEVFHQITIFIKVFFNEKHVREELNKLMIRRMHSL
jgi:hypothetical protein